MLYLAAHEVTNSTLLYCSRLIRVEVRKKRVMHRKIRGDTEDSNVVLY